MSFKIMNHCKDDIIDLIINKKYAVALDKLMIFGMTYNISGNLYYKYLLYSLIFNENPYTRLISLNKNTYSIDIVKEDLELYYELLTHNIEEFNPILDFKYFRVNSNIELNDRIELLSSVLDLTTFNKFTKTLYSFYQQYGVGIYSVYKAFKIVDNKLVPLDNIKKSSFDDIIGYDYQKEELKNNTLAFLNNKDSNNVLLYGSSGTGKSSSIKALLNEYYLKGLRIIEVYKKDLEALTKIMDELIDLPYKFIIYMDDLSFESEEVEYKYLKSIIEGRIEEKPSNVLVYATSNRRHLIKETLSDNSSLNGEINRKEGIDEKLSLANRFGLKIYYGGLNSKEFQDMVVLLASKYNIDMPKDKLLRLANQWQMANGELSGRTVTQFIYSIKE